MSISTAGASLRPKQRRMLTDDVVDAIRDAILNDELPAGARLIEDDLAATLKVSRGPVRQAIFRLQQEGLVAHEPHRGATVAKVSAADAEEIFTLRTALEELSIARACRLATAEDLARLETILERFRDIPRAQVTRKRAAEIDIEFHDALFQAAHHERLRQAWERLRSQVFLFLLLRDLQPAGFKDSWHKDHKYLADLVRARDEASSVKSIREHLGSAYARLLAQMAAGSER